MSAIQVKNVPEPLHEALRRRAAAEGLSLNEYILSVLRRDLSLPSRRQWLDDLASRDAVQDVDVVDAVEQDRRDRDAELAAARRP